MAEYAIQLITIAHSDPPIRNSANIFIFSPSWPVSPDMVSSPAVEITSSTGPQTVVDYTHLHTTTPLYMGLFPGCCTTALLLERRDISHVSPQLLGFQQPPHDLSTRVFGSFSGKAISAGTAIRPNTCRTWSFNWLLAFASAIRFTSLLGTRTGGDFRLPTLR